MKKMTVEFPSPVYNTAPTPQVREQHGRVDGNILRARGSECLQENSSLDTIAHMNS